ncbi:MAG: hypothetical protein ABR540_22490, partial [Acidimicrobiales bacterium]
HLHPAADTSELRSLAPDWAARVDDLDVVTGPGSLGALALRAGATLIGHRVLRDAQRTPAPSDF